MASGVDIFGHGTERARATVAALRDRITSGEWPLNSKIPTEAELVEELGVGRSTVREAVRTLANLGMLEPARSRGTFVRSVSPVNNVLTEFISQHGIGDQLALRRAFEVEAAHRAALHRTEENLAALRASLEGDRSGQGSANIERGVTPGTFHTLMFTAAHSPLLSAMYASVMSGIRLAMPGGLIPHAIDDETRIHEHLRILDAIERRDAEEAAHAAGEHADHDLVLATDRDKAMTTSR